MASNPTATLSSLLKQSSITDHDEVLRACNASLKNSKTDLEALHAKVVALLKLDRYDDALRVLDEGGEEIKKKAALERAYALYKVGRLEEAEKVVKNVSSRGGKHVEAQTVRIQTLGACTLSSDEAD
jgi:signal recognition particle subunit SRP72